MRNTIYTRITEVTATNAKERVRKELNDLTNGEAQKALDLAIEYYELEGILEEFEERR